VHIHDLNTAPLKSFSETGLVMADGQHYDFDAVVLATGFDSYSGSLTRMGLKNRQGVDLRDDWAHGVHTFLGITISGFPNFFMSYTPQAPTALSNGPTIIECQIENIVDAISKLEARGARSIEPTREAEERWKEVLDGMSDLTLMRFTDSWWNGANIPGKKSQSLVYVGGIDVYEKQVREELQNGAGFDIVDSS
jgi:cation diffusion facilitator CzcD-associated flavoprotein CzcO